MILGNHVSDRKTFYGTIEALKMAEAKMAKKGSNDHVLLATDGGRENHNEQVEKYLAGINGLRFTKIRALKEIIYSNSPVEAIHRIGRLMITILFAHITNINRTHRTKSFLISH